MQWILSLLWGAALDFVVLWLVIPPAIHNFEPRWPQNTRKNAAIVAFVMALTGSAYAFQGGDASFSIGLNVLPWLVSAAMFKVIYELGLGLALGLGLLTAVILFLIKYVIVLLSAISPYLAAVAALAALSVPLVLWHRDRTLRRKLDAM